MDNVAKQLRHLLVLIVAVALALAFGSGPGHAQEPTATPQVPLMPVSLQPGQKLPVLATTSIVADVVKQVGGEAIEVTTLLPLGTDPHTFEPTPRDMAAVANSGVIFANGAGLESFIDRMMDNAGGKAATVYLSDGLVLRTLLPGEHEEETAVGQADHEERDTDPHTWLSPINVLGWSQNASRALSQLDPSHAQDYARRADAYEQALTELDVWITAQVALIPPEHRKIVADHLTYGYFCERYGFEQIGAVVSSFSTAAQPSAQELAQLEDAVRREGVTAVFVSNVVNDAMSRRLSEDMGIKLITLYDGSLGPPGSGAETYLDFMRYNTNAIVNALKQ